MEGKLEGRDQEGADTVRPYVFIPYLLNNWGLGCVRAPHTPQLSPLY
jgi:hypothetical protein